MPSSAALLLEKQPFNSLEMELKTARGPRWISIAGDPIIDTAGRFEGFRGVGSRHHRDPPDAGAADPPRQHGRAVRPAQSRPRPPAARRGACARRPPAMCPARSCSSTSTASSRSTTPSATPRATPCCSAVAKRLVDEVGGDGHVGRMGGDEFAIVVIDAQSRRKVEEPGRPHHQVGRRALHDRPDRNPHRRLDRLRLRPDRRRDRRRSDPQGRPRALRSQGRRPRHRPLFLVRAAVGAGGPRPPRNRPRARRSRPSSSTSSSSLWSTPRTRSWSASKR